MRSLRYTLRTLRRSGRSAVLRSFSVGVAAALTFFVLAQTSTVRAQAEQLSVGGIDASVLERATVCLTVIAIVVGALQIGVTMTRVVLRRMGEIGILKAAGIRNREIFLVFAFEALIYGALGGVLGCLLGAVMMLFGPAPEVGEAMRAAAITIGLAVVVSAAAGAIPALRAMRASAVEAISYAW